jgi:predicted metal-dependent hydrolase
MLTPPEVINSVVVHELCHRKEMNHSEKFYSHVLRAFPDYWKWRRWLVKNGGAIIRRLEK